LSLHERAATIGTPTITVEIHAIANQCATTSPIEPVGCLLALGLESLGLPSVRKAPRARSALVVSTVTTLTRSRIARSANHAIMNHKTDSSADDKAVNPRTRMRRPGTATFIK
jgi:hypothetical protein